MTEENAKGMAEEAITPEQEQQIPDNQREEEIQSQPGEGDQQQEEVNHYTKEELEEIIASDGVIDRKRLTPDQLAIQQTFEKGYQKKFQEAARIKKEAEERIALAKPDEPKQYYTDPEKNRVFTEYLSNPAQSIGQINAEIARLETIQPYDEDGDRNPQYSDARKTIAQWQTIKDEFMFKRESILEEKRQTERIETEYGTDAKKLEAYATELGFSTDSFRKSKALRDNVKRLYDLLDAGKSAENKLKKPIPPKINVPGGVGPARPKNDVEKMPINEFIKRRNEQQYKNR